MFAIMDFTVALLYYCFMYHILNVFWIFVTYGLYKCLIITIFSGLTNTWKVILFVSWQKVVLIKKPRTDLIFLLLFSDLVLLKRTLTLLGTKSVCNFLSFLIHIFSWWTCPVFCLVVFSHTQRQRLVIFCKIRTLAGVSSVSTVRYLNIHHTPKAVKPVGTAHGNKPESSSFSWCCTGSGSVNKGVFRIEEHDINLRRPHSYNAM